MGVAWLSHQLFVCLSSERSWSSRTDGPSYSGCFIHACMNACMMAGAAVSCSDSNWQGRLSTCPWLLPSSVAQKLQRVNESQKENESQRCLNYCHKQMRNFDTFEKVWIFPTVNSVEMKSCGWVLLSLRWTEDGFWKGFLNPLCTAWLVAMGSAWSCGVWFFVFFFFF